MMMESSRDPSIKLFGMKIPFPANFEPSVAVEEVKELQDNSPGKATSELSEKNNNKEETTSADHQTQTESSDSPEDSNQQTTADGKPVLKKPTKILPCPRCKSMDTKFCYYNNYNVNQPRHFCKACQRYWTAGGIMRNVPVGAGRRKNKSSSSHYRHITVSEALEAARLDHQGFQAKTRVLSFGLEARQHQAAPVASVVKPQNGLTDQRVEKGDDCSSGSSVTTSNNHSADESRAHNRRVAEPHMNNMNGYAPWPYTWSPAMTPPGYYPPPPHGYPMPFYPYWTIPMLPLHQSSSHTSQTGSNPNTLTFGKHSRDLKKDSETEEKQRNVRVLVPKTLRIDDPDEAAKSSIWTTLGIMKEGVSKGGMFKGFDEKTKRNNDDENSPALSANPAALSRSHNFHERM